MKSSQWSFKTSQYEIIPNYNKHVKHQQHSSGHETDSYRKNVCHSNTDAQPETKTTLYFCV